MTPPPPPIDERDVLDVLEDPTRWPDLERRLGDLSAVNQLDVLLRSVPVEGLPQERREAILAALAS